MTGGWPLDKLRGSRLTGRAYILENQVAHTRLLPIASRHSFAYPTLSLLVSLNSLEEKQLDLLGGWLFGYGSIWGSVTGLRPSGYLHNGPSDNSSIRRKLVQILDQHGYSGCELHDAWFMTMPSFLGIEGINPLSVYFCYRQGSSTLWFVILEVSHRDTLLTMALSWDQVHNTFEERHVYVLETDDESKQTPSARLVL